MPVYQSPRLYQSPRQLCRASYSASAPRSSSAPFFAAARERSFESPVFQSSERGMLTARADHSFSRLSVLPPDTVSRQALDDSDGAAGAGTAAASGTDLAGLFGSDPAAASGVADAAGADLVGAGGTVGAAPSCAQTPGCGPSFCSPFSLPQFVVRQMLAQAAPVLLAGIAAKVSPRVVGLWSQYLFGGAAPQDLSGQFGGDFTKSATTAATTDFLFGELVKSLISNPPVFPDGVNTVTVDIPTRIASAIAQIGTPGDPSQMDFNVIGEVPGNIAGGIGKNEASCPVGAKPSPFDDDRSASGTATVTRNPDNTLTVDAGLQFAVKDTVDLCPGNCGADIEQNATVPMSRFEASGVSGDVPFTVNFPAPPRQATTPPVAPTPTPPLPVPPQPPPTPTGTFQSKRFSGDPTLEACAQGTHRMTFGETDKAAVAKVQQTLIDAGFALPISTGSGVPDGVFGQETADAITQFKISQKISPSDPVIGPKTVMALDGVAAGEGQ